VALIKKDNTGMSQKLISIEEQVLTISKASLDKWRKYGIKVHELEDFY